MTADAPVKEWAKCTKHHRMRGNQHIWFDTKNQNLRRIQTKVEIPEEPCDLCIKEVLDQKSADMQKT